MRCRDRRDVDTSANGLISLYSKNGISMAGASDGRGEMQRVA
eukprot:COSAG02_NODE_64005_length_261_cov_1.555556_1_plen_41_part_10